MITPKGWRTVRRSTGSETYITEVSTAKASEVEEIARAAERHGMASGAFLRMAGLALARGTEPEMVAVRVEDIAPERLVRMMTDGQRAAVLAGVATGAAKP